MSIFMDNGKDNKGDLEKLRGHLENNNISDDAVNENKGDKMKKTDASDISSRGCGLKSIVSKANVNWNFIAVFLLFAISLAVRFKIADFIKIPLVQPDEFRYYLLAKSFSQGLGMSINGFSTFYQKIFYPLCITPAFWFKNIFVTITSISFINAFLVSSGLFPLYFLSKKILSEKKYIFLTLLVYVFFSDLAYSVTFMSEVAFLPLCLWLLLVFYNIVSSDENNRRKYFFLCTIAGILNYALYLTKEISLVFILAYAGFIIFEAIKTKKIKSTKVFGFLFYFVSYLFLFVLFKLTLFAGSGNSYNQQSFDILFKPGRLGFMIYSFFYYIGMSLFSLLFIPIILSVLNFKNYELKDKRFLLFIFLLLLLSSGVVAYTISVREDFGNIFSIRFHARYTTYLYLPFIIYFFKCFEFKERINFKLNFENILLLILNIGSILIININNGIWGCHADNTILYFLKYLSLEQQNFNVFYFKIYILIFIVFSLFLLRYKFYSYIFSVLFIIIMLYNNVEFYKICKNAMNTMNTERQITNTCEIANFISLNKDKMFIYINSDLLNINDEFFYTCNNNLNLKYLYNYYNSYYGKREIVDYNYKNTDIKYVILDCPKNLDCPKKFVNKIPVDKYRELPICNRCFRIFKLKNRKLTGLITNKIDLYILSLDSIYLRNSDWYGRDIIIHPNGFIYGPYIKLKKGKYEVEFVLKNNIEAELSATFDNGKNKIKQITTNRDIERMSFELDKDAENIEFLVKNLAEKDLRVKDIILRVK